MATPNWDTWQFLLGEWIGEGGGQPGQGRGAMTFEFDLQQQLLLRKNHMDFLPTRNVQPLPTMT